MNPTADSDTPRTDAAIYYADPGYDYVVKVINPDFARQLERELAAMTERAEQAERELAKANEKLAQWRSDFHAEVKRHNKSEGESCRMIAGMRLKLQLAERERDQLRTELDAEKAKRVVDPDWHANLVKTADDLLSDVRELAPFKTRMLWLHDCSTGCKDPDGFEWGIFRVKWDANGQPVEVLQTLSDFSDLDKEMTRELAAIDAARKEVQPNQPDATP